MTDAFDPRDIPQKVIEMQLKLFREKFGRDPRPGDPLLFDPDDEELADPDNQPDWEVLGFLEWGMLNFEMTKAMDDEVERLCKEIDQSRQSSRMTKIKKRPVRPLLGLVVTR